MHRYTHQLNRIRNEIADHPRPDARVNHDQRLANYMNAANAEPEIEIPQSLHGGGQQEIRRVTPATIAYLIEGKRIARTVRFLLPNGAGNQRLMLMHSNGFNRPITDAAQTLGELHGDSQWPACSAIIAGGGNCLEHAEVAFEIARSLGLPVALVSNHSADHAFAVLHPETSAAVVIDAWTVFPSSCLLADSSFLPDKEIARYRPGDAVPGGFNLHNINILQQRLEQVSGTNSLRGIFAESYRQFHGLRSTLLDRMLHNHGLLHYYQFSGTLCSPPVQAEINNLQHQLSEKIFHEAANHVGVTCTFTDQPPTVLPGDTGTIN